MNLETMNVLGISYVVFLIQIYELAVFIWTCFKNKVSPLLSESFISLHISLTAHFVWGTLLSVGDTKINKTKSLLPRNLHFSI